MTDNTEVLERITPNLPRRVIAAGSLGALGALLVLIAATHPPSDIGFSLFLILVGLGSLWLAVTLWRVSGRVLELTREELREQEGRVLARLDNVAKVDRGFFAFKPAAGFRLSLKDKAPSAYAPGLWWRRGRMVMVGGATSGTQSKAVADLMSILIAQQRGEL
ncbi:hypothetical protein [Nioella nitratireducens]|uniref:hypothetical protein n=1 Tax=Nioella nitratireducens TaxID=1287720 RepID=UPI0008FD4513|nr:hypothetical protein [Nioella nitratireducens]